MPIKFRCQHCRQFLGISRGKAGSVVDCPTCGRTIRVPDLDGHVKPLPKPGLDLKDSELRKALDELASIGHGAPANDDLADAAAADVSAGGGRVKAALPIARAEAIELPPVPPAQPIDVSAHPARPKDDPASKGRTRRQEDAGRAIMVDDEDDSSDEPQARPDDRAETDARHVPDAAQITAPQHRRSLTRTIELAPGFWFACCGVAAIVFTAGFWVGRVTTIQSPSPGDSPAHGTHIQAGGESQSKNTDPVLQSAFRGRITYRTEGGDRKADRGARVIMLPVDRSGKAKLPIAGFLAGDSLEDQRVARAALQAMGGDFAVTNEAGEYSTTLPSAGQFHVLVLSNSLSRPEDESLQLLEAILSQYFERPVQLLGKVMVHSEQVRFSGQGTEPWDFSFQSS